jgi:hypothetical protein
MPALRRGGVDALASDAPIFLGRDADVAQSESASETEDAPTAAGPKEGGGVVLEGGGRCDGL